MAESIQISVDGTPQRLTVDDPDMPLLYALRDELGLDNPRFGCGLAQCGACTVHVDGVPTRSCVTPLSQVVGHQVTTIAGLGAPERPHPLQAAFAELQATQCGYCMNGWMMTAAALVREQPHASTGADQRRAVRAEMPVRHASLDHPRRRARHRRGIGDSHEPDRTAEPLAPLAPAGRQPAAGQFCQRCPGQGRRHRGHPRRRSRPTSSTVSSRCSRMARSSRCTERWILGRASTSRSPRSSPRSSTFPSPPST